MEINETNRKRLRKAYANAVEDGALSFMFDGEEILTRFGKYLLEYFDMQLGKEAANESGLRGHKEQDQRGA